MADTPPLWRSTARKEAIELLEHLWATGDAATRDRLSAALAAGPPEHLLAAIAEPEERQTSRDRRIFDRIGVIERDGQEPLTPQLQAVMADIREREPQWALAPGDQARFSWWMEFRLGDNAEPQLEQLEALQAAAEIADRLLTNVNEDPHADLPDAWRQFTIKNPDRALDVLKILAARDDGGPVELWRGALWGLRDRVKAATILDSVLAILLDVPVEHFAHAAFSQAVADLLEAGARGTKALLSANFWRVFDMTLEHASLDPSNLDVPDDGQWVSLAINRSMGHLATALFNGLFAYRLKVNDKIPAEQSERLDRVVGLGIESHRLARVIAASRLPYLFAVDPDWARSTMVPLLDWEADELEATATWQGFTWHPRLSEELWEQIKPQFLEAFAHGRLERFGGSRKTMAELVMLAGLTFDLGPDQARATFRMMTDEMRAEAVWWLWNDLGRADDEAQSQQADERWINQVEPWLSKAWPRDPDLITRHVGRNFALLATAMQTAFPRAVAFVTPFLVKGDSSLLLDRLTVGTHADRHPGATLHLLAGALDLGRWTDWREVGALLARIGKADPALTQRGDFREIDARVQVARA